MRHSSRSMVAQPVKGQGQHGGGKGRQSSPNFFCWHCILNFLLDALWQPPRRRAATSALNKPGLASTATAGHFKPLPRQPPLAVRCRLPATADLGQVGSSNPGSPGNLTSQGPLPFARNYRGGAFRCQTLRSSNQANRNFIVEFDAGLVPGR